MVMLVCSVMKDSMRQGDKKEQLLQELRTREQELEFTLTKQREVQTPHSLANMFDSLNLLEVYLNLPVCVCVCSWRAGSTL